MFADARRANISFMSLYGWSMTCAYTLYTYTTQKKQIIHQKKHQRSSPKWLQKWCQIFVVSTLHRFHCSAGRSDAVAGPPRPEGPGVQRWTPRCQGAIRSPTPSPGICPTICPTMDQRCKFVKPNPHQMTQYDDTSNMSSKNTSLWGC